MDNENQPLDENVEETSTENQNISIEPEIPTMMMVTEDMRSYLYDAARWARFIGIAGMIMAVLVLLSGLSLTATLSRPEFRQAGVFSNFAPQDLVLLFLVMGGFVFAVSFFLYKFAQKTTQGILYMHPESLTQGLKKLKTYFTFQGILLLIYFAINILAIIMKVIK
ncbi:MAG: hypothetical protein EOO99_11620 [Pedobacter sp.]|nr:MAG: hypothetical protein EOO99_11620 [Pedobacter sp.]